MRLLLDENVPRQLKQVITGHEVYTIGEKRWNGKLNGELLKLMLAEEFDALITADKNFTTPTKF